MQMSRTIFLLCFLIIAGKLFAQSTTYPASLTVAKDGSGNYKTIQEAVNAVRDLSQVQVKIFIKNGIYNEKLIVPSWKTNIALIGESEENTIITNGDYTGKDYPGKDLSGKEKYMTFTTYTVLVQGNDFTAEHLTIQNTAGPVGQAVALHVEGDRVRIRNCRLLGHQDTLYVGTEKSRQYYQDCYIEGTTDFIFGEATVVFKACTIKSLANSYVTAAATTPHQKFGLVLMNCKLMADSAVTKVYLGRPWRPYARTTFIHCELGKHILPQGWDPWKGDAMFPDKEKTTTYAEFGSVGAGASKTSRVVWSKQLSESEAKSFTLKNILGGSDDWNPLSVSIKK
jgi:pectinesterase